LVRENPDPPMTVIARVGREGVECASREALRL
jgi:hypothetical protein